MKTALRLLSFPILVFLLTGCHVEEQNLSANLEVSSATINETHSNQSLNLPSGAHQVGPNFDMNDPSTWTGNIAQYVSTNYIYHVYYDISNTGEGTAYDTEVDLECIYDNGDIEIKTVDIGSVSANSDGSHSTPVICANRQLIQCNATIYWYDTPE